MNELGGIIPAVVTPMKEDGQVDFPAYERQISFLAEAGVSRQLFLPLFTTHVCHFSPETDAGRGHPAGRKAFGELHLV